MSQWDKLRARLAQHRGKMVTVSVVLDREGVPICWSVQEDARTEGL